MSSLNKPQQQRPTCRLPAVSSRQRLQKKPTSAQEKQKPRVPPHRTLPGILSGIRAVINLRALSVMSPLQGCAIIQTVRDESTLL